MHHVSLDLRVERFLHRVTSTRPSSVGQKFRELLFAQQNPNEANLSDLLRQAERADHLYHCHEQAVIQGVHLYYNQ